MGEERQIRQVRSARQMPVRVQRLDDEILDVAVDKRAVGWVLFDIVCEQLNIIEKDYFGLNFINPEGVKYWLDNEKKIAKQMKGIVSLHLCFEVKFYPIDPLQMVEDITRYQLCLQIRRDIVNERVPCSTVTYALLGSFTAQSELGDFEVEDFGSGTSYLKEIQFAPKQDRDLLAQIAKLHKQHKGMTPEEAEIKFLENAEKLQFYGVEQHPAKDADGKDISLGVCAAGIIVYKDRQQVNRFVWPKILKMSYKRNKFYIKIRPGEFENFASLIGFRTVSVKMAKRLWKICVEHHSFFRFKEPESVKKYSVIPRFGSRFRYSGRTQYQSRQYVTAEDRDMPSFDRVLSKRGTFGGRTQNMRKRDEDRKRQRDQMRREPPPPPVQQDFGPPQTKLPKEYHEEPNGTRQEPKRTPPEPKHAPPVAPKPKPQIAPKPKPASRGPPSIDSASLDRGSRGSLNDSFEDVPDRRSRMEKMNAVMTPLAAVMQKSLQQNKHPEDEEVDGSHHEDDQRHHTDDEFEVGMRADKARNSFRLTNTDDGCRKTDKYLFSYPSSSIDSILSNDFEEYDTESNSCRNGLKNVASEEFLNKPETFDRNKLEQGQGSFKGQSYSAENLLSEETLSHYSMIDPRTSEGIYAEIEDLKTSIPTRNSNKLTQKSNTNRPDSIHGRRSKQFIPNQSSSTTMSLEHHQTQDASIASCTNQENNSSKRGRGKQNNDTLKLINSQVPGYAIVSKNRKDIPVSAKNPNSSINFDYDKSCDVILKTPIEPFYDTIENAKEPSHQRQDSQTSLKEELKMYIITPEKLKHNSETVYENSQFDNGESDQKHIKALYMNVTEKQCADENNIYQNPVDESIESGKLEQAEKRNREEKTEVNDCDESVLDQRNIPLNNKGEGCESSAIEMNHIPVLDDRKQIYQLTYDTSALNSPEGPKDSLSELELLPYSNSFSLNATEQEYINISNISSNSLDIGLAHSDPCKVNDETLDKSLELFCSLSTDSSDFDEPDTVKFGEKNNKKLEVRKNETLNISSTEKNSNLVKFQSSREEQTKGSKYEISETDSRKDVEKADKPKSVLGKVSSLVRKVPGFGPKVSKIKEKFKCEDFEKEPVRRMKPLQESSKCKLMAEDDNTSKIRNLKSSKIENKIELKEQHEFSNDKKSSDLITTPRNEKDKKSKYKVSKYDEGSTMDFFTKPETLEEFEEKAVCESDVLNASTNSNSSERVKMLDVNPFDNITDIQEIKYDFEKEELACPLDIEQKEIKSGTNVLPSDKSNVLLNKKEDKTTSLVSTNDDIDKDLKERKNPNPYWYKTHLLASKGSEEHENIKDTHQLPNIPQKDRKSSSISFSNTPPESIDLFSNKKLKAPYKTKETKPKVKRRDHKSESPKKTDSKSFPSTKNCYLSSPPEVRGSKVFVRDQALNNEPAKGMGQSCSHDKIKLPLIPATNLMHNKPLYKLDYSSDSSSSFSSINTHNNKDTRAHVKNGKQKSKKSRTSTSMETEFSNDSRNVSKSNNVVTDRRKIYPGVLHMVRPGPTGWIEGGVKSSVKRNETKLENKTSNTAPTSNLNTAPNIPDSLGDFAEKEICSSREITNGKVGEVMADRIDSTDHDHNEFESKSNDVGISLQNNAVSPVSELLCKRVWKYSKHKQENKDKENEGHDEDESDDYFTRAIEQGPDYKDNFGTSSSFGSSEAADNNQTGGSLPSKDETNTKYREQNLSSSADVVLSQIENQGKDDFEKNQDYHQNEINCDDSPLLEFGEEMAEHSKALSIENKTLQLSAKDNQGQDCVFEIDEFILPTSKENKDSRQRFQKKTSIKRKVCDEMIAETGSEGTTSTSDSSSENSYDISDEDSSAEEIVSFEMPKPRQTEGIIESTDVDIPFADEVGDVANDSPSSDLSGIAIDCSFEDVTSYQVNKGQSKNLATASDMYSNNFSQDDANYWDEDIEFSDYDDPMGEVEDPHIIPEVIDHTPFTTGKSNLKNSVRKETWFFDRRVHFQENLPVYKSRKNIGFHDDKPTDETLMNRAYDEGNKIDHLEKFIVGLFDEEPRNLSIPKLTPNTSSLPSPTSPYNLSKNFKDKSHNENNIFGYHSSITSENVNFSLDTLQTFAINEMNIGRDDRGDVITTDLDTIDYNDNQFEATFGTNSDFVKSNVPIKTEKRPPPKILKPVTGKKTKYSNADVGDTNFSQYNKTPDLFNFRSQNDAQNKIDQHYTASSHLNYGQRPSYRSQCSAELINGTWSYERPCSQSYPLPDLTDTNSGVSSTVYTRNQGREHLCDEPPNVCYNVEQTDKPITNQYVDVSQLSKNDQMTETNSDDDKITSESKKDQLEQSSSSNKVTRYSYSYADDSDSECPKIKYVTYEYVTEYKLNNVKIHYQHNKKVQTDLNLIQVGKESPCLNSSENVNNSAIGEVPQEITESFVKETYCGSLEHYEKYNPVSQNTVNENLPNCKKSGEVLEEIVEPAIRKSFCIPLEDSDDNSTRIIVEEANKRSVCYPLGPIIGAQSDCVNDFKETILEEDTEKFITFKTSNNKETENCRYNEQSDRGYEDKTSNKHNFSDKLHDTQKTFTQNRDNQLNDFKSDSNECIGKGYTDKQVLEYKSEKYVFQCYQPTFFGTKRFPRYLPGCKRREKAENLSEEMLHLKTKTEILLDCDEVSIEKGTEDSFEIEILDISKGLTDSDNKKLNDDPQGECEADTDNYHINVYNDSWDVLDVNQLKENDKDYYHEKEEIINHNESLNDIDNFYTTVMQEELPALHVEDTTKDELFVMQTIAIMAFGAVLVFLLPYMG